jgi:2-polyprenyl-6-methoxyphenol hydroxylase-like FAD-dependent oxidoreductase
VLGGGIAGLAAAIGLRDAGYGVTVFEQAPEIEPLGAAISLWPNAVAALRILGALGPVEREAAPITSMLLATRDGGALLGPWTVGPPRHGERAYLPTRALVQRALAAALGDVPVQLGRRAEQVDDCSDRVRIHLDGEVFEADLLVAADGIHSATGTALIGNPPQERGYSGVLALSDPVDAAPLDGVAAEYWGRGERFGVFDLGQQRRYWFYMTDEPLPAFDREQLLAKARNGWPAAVADAIVATPADRLIPVTIAARAVPRRLAAGRIICVGDAAHAMEPNLGQGACQALEDAVALGTLAVRLQPGDVASAFDRARRRRVVGMMRRAQEGGWAAHGPYLRQAIARGALRLTPAAVQRRMVDGFYRLPAY